MVVVPVTGVSRLAEHAISEALSISTQVICVTVLTSQTPGGDGDARARELQEQWVRWNPGVPLRVLRTEYASVAGPILALVDQLSGSDRDQVVVLIPVAVPDRARYRVLHNQLDRALSSALSSRPDVVTVRVPMPLHLAAAEPQAQRPSPKPAG